ncbi:MAG: hypothetical protein Q4B42_04565 [Oscillospiraceae bacterium]|nr:hypothetical protein [Oscillospiraceae bacterium]
MRDKNAIWDFLAAFLGLSCIEWEEDFPSDGCRDLWGRDFAKPLFAAPLCSEEEPALTIKILKGGARQRAKRLG